jgi:hypothetical protein
LLFTVAEITNSKEIEYSPEADKISNYLMASILNKSVFLNKSTPISPIEELLVIVDCASKLLRKDGAVSDA